MKQKTSIKKMDQDLSIRPQDDFFQFAAGGWIKRNPIPKTESIWSRFHKLRQENLTRLNVILKELKTKERLPKGSEAQILRDFYISGMDMKTRNTLDLKPIEHKLQAIEKIQTHNDVLSFIFSEHKAGQDVLWSHFVGQDDKNNTQYIFHLSQSTLSLPDRDYYLKNDTQSKKVCKKFYSYVQIIFTLAGKDKKTAPEDAKTVLSLETKLAHIMMSRTNARNIDKVYNKMSISQLKKIAPDIPWSRYFKELGVNQKVKKLLVLQPQYLKKLGTLIKRTPVKTWRTYFFFTLVNDAAPHLSKKYTDTHFSFYGEVLSGNKKKQPLWKRVTQVIDAYIGEALGKEYIKRYFSPQAKEKINELVDDLLLAYKKRMQALTWMTSQTKKRALKKLSNTTRKLGYPDKWKSYKGLVIKPETYFENIERAELYEYKRNINKLGKKVDRKEWFMPPQTVNAYCDLNNNEVVFPAGILQPPFFDPEGDDAVNYGCMGSIIGHEMTHNFDNTGSKFDENGNYKKWWTEKDEKEFKKRSRVLVRQYNQFKVDQLTVNGELTLGENIADLGGLEIGVDAYKIHMEHTPQRTILGFTPLQRFFLGLVTFEAEHATKETRHMRVLVDPHSPAKYRVNGPFSNMNSFYEAFNVRPGDRLYRAPKDRAKIW